MAVFVAQLVVFNLIVPFEGTFTLLGGASLILAYITTFAGIYIYFLNILFFLSNFLLNFFI